MEEIDYKELLRKYMEHVYYFGGVNYVGDTSTTEFTDKEKEALKELIFT